MRRETDRERSIREDGQWYADVHYCFRCGKRFIYCDCTVEERKAATPPRNGWSWFGLIGLQYKAKTDKLNPIAWLRRRRATRRKEKD